MTLKARHESASDAEILSVARQDEVPKFILNDFIFHIFFLTLTDLLFLEKSWEKLSCHQSLFTLELSMLLRCLANKKARGTHFLKYFRRIQYMRNCCGGG